MNPQMGGAGPGHGNGDEPDGRDADGRHGWNESDGAWLRWGMAQMGAWLRWGHGLSAPAFPSAPPRQPPIRSTRHRSFSAEPASRRNSGTGTRRTARRGDVLSDLTSGMMGMGVGKKQGHRGRL